MSDTPETDANGIDISSSIMQVQTKYVRADFAERLERERDALLELTRLHCDLYDQLCEQEEPSDGRPPE